MHQQVWIKETKMNQNPTFIIVAVIIIIIIIVTISNTVKCRYNTVQYNKILCTYIMQKLRQNIKWRLNPQKTAHTSPWNGSYGVSFVNFFYKIDRVMALHCIIIIQGSNISFIFKQHISKNCAHSMHFCVVM